jgi:hypothetical protein
VAVDGSFTEVIHLNETGNHTYTGFTIGVDYSQNNQQILLLATD